MWMPPTAVPQPAPLQVRDTGETSAHSIRRAQHKDTEAPPRRRLYCLRCQALVTDSGARVERRGRHVHVFVNPEGLEFRIGCFARAPGCRSVGAATRQWTWFPGFAWQVAVCSGCGAHLGWRYSGADADSFHGLILATLVERTDEP